MSSGGFVYRLNQKLKYHLVSDDFEKMVAEINRYKEWIAVEGDSFSINPNNIRLKRPDHEFVIERIDTFKFLENYGNFEIRDGKLQFTIDGIKLNILTAEELFIAREIFLDKQYNFLINEDQILVIDIGMNVGMASLFFANKKNVEKVYAFEPFFMTFNEGEENLKLNPQLAEKIDARNIGIGKSKSTIKANYSTSMKGKNTTTDTELTQGEPISLISLSEVLNEISSNDDDSIVVKMDCEGAEFGIFENLKDSGIPKSVKGFMIEWHNKSPEPIIETLIQNDFKVLQTGHDTIGLITAFR